MFVAISEADVDASKSPITVKNTEVAFPITVKNMEVAFSMFFTVMDFLLASTSASEIASFSASRVLFSRPTALKNKATSEMATNLHSPCLKL